MKKSIAFCLIACIMMFFSVSCSSNNESKETVRVIAHAQMEDVMEPFFAKFMAENPDIKVEVLYGVDQLDQIETNFPPDLLFTGNVQLEQIKNLFVDLNPLMTDYFGSEQAKNEFMNTFLDGTVDSLEKGGSQLVLPVNANVSLLYYNEDIFNAASIDYPTNNWTLDDFVSVGKSLTKIEDNKYTQWGASTTSGWWGEYLIYARLFGGDFYDENGDLALNTTEFKKGIQFFKDKVVGENKFSVNPGSTAVGEGDLGGFAGGATAMEFGGHTGNWPSYNAKENFNWNVAMIPTPSDNANATGAELAVEGYGIYKNALNKEKALKVLMYMFSEEGQEMFGSLGRLVPTYTYKDYILETPYDERPNPKNMEAVFAQIENSMVLPTNPNFSASACAPTYNEISKFLNGTITNVDAWAISATQQVNDYVATLG